LLLHSLPLHHPSARALHFRPMIPYLGWMGPEISPFRPLEKWPVYPRTRPGGRCSYCKGFPASTPSPE